MNRYIVLYIVSLLVVQNLAAQPALLDQYRAEWANIHTCPDSLDVCQLVTVASKVGNKADTKPLVQQFRTYQGAYLHAVLNTTSLNDTPLLDSAKRILVTNHQYSFGIKRTESIEENRFILDECNLEYNKFVKSNIDIVSQISESINPLMVMQVSLLDLNLPDKYKIVSVADATRNQVKTTRIDFECTPRTTAEIKTVDGFIEFDNHIPYLPVHAELRQRHADGFVKITIDIQYEAYNGCVLIGVRTAHITLPNQQDSAHWQTSFKYYPAPSNDDQFYLSYYGLPEPVGFVRPNRIPNYVWYLSIAGVLAMAMLLCGWLLKRRAKARSRAASAAKPPLPSRPPSIEIDASGTGVE